MAESNFKKSSPQPWIQSAPADLFCFIFSGVLIFLAYLWVDQSAFRNEGRWFLLSLTLLLTVFHRHLTFPLVYGDPEQFNARRKTYMWLPVFFLVLTTASVLYVTKPVFESQALPQPLSFQKGDQLMVYTREEGKPNRYLIQFTGQEKNLSDVAQAFNKPLAGKVAVKPKSGALHFQAPRNSSVSRFSIHRYKGEGLRERLGMPRRTLVNWIDQRPIFIFLLILSALWNFYHVIMQKMGILRIYSRKAGYGKPWLDKAMVFVWFGWLFFALTDSPKIYRQVSRLAKSGKFLTNTMKPVMEWVPYIAKGLLIAALVITALYIIEEWKNRKQHHLPKNLFMASILGIYFMFFYDFLVGFVVFGFSHAIEYLAIVNIFSKHKFKDRPKESSLMAKWVKHQSIYFGIFLIGSTFIFVPWYFEDRISLNWYIVGTSYMHFLYDGWIWKVRDSKVGKPLGINYSNPAQVEAA